MESVFNIIAGLKGCRFIEKRLQHRRFPVNIVKLLRTFFFVEHLRWLLLNSFYSKYYPLIRINAIYAMNISAQFAMTREIFPQMRGGSRVAAEDNFFCSICIGS